MFKSDTGERGTSYDGCVLSMSAPISNYCLFIKGFE